MQTYFYKFRLILMWDSLHKKVGDVSPSQGIFFAPENVMVMVRQEQDQRWYILDLCNTDRHKSNLGNTLVDGTLSDYVNFAH